MRVVFSHLWVKKTQRRVPGAAGSVGSFGARRLIRRSMTRAAVTGVLDDDDDETVSWTSSSRTSSSWDDANRDDASTSASNGTDDVDDFDDFDDDAGRRREMRALERQIETSVDALKLLYLIDRYTGGPAVWMTNCR